MEDMNVCVALRVVIEGDFEDLKDFEDYVKSECLVPEEVGITYLCGETEDSKYFIDRAIDGAVPPHGLVEISGEEIETIGVEMESDFTDSFFESAVTTSFVVYFK